MKIHLLVALSILACLQPGAASAQEDFKKEVRMMSRGEQQQAFIAKFAQQAKDKDVAAILQEVDAKMLKQTGEAEATRWLQDEILPFFASFAKLHNYEQITNAVLPDGRSGLMHYTYIVDANGKVRPFVIAVIDSDAGPRLLTVKVDQCVKGRHPFCD